MSSHSAVLKKIRTQRIRLALLMSGLIALCAWQNHFIVGGLLANVYHNAGIIVVFVFGLVLATVKIFGLDNDVKALLALSETYDDLRKPFAPNAAETEERFAKVTEPAVVFGRSRILGHVYELCVEELQRTRSMKVGVSTMQQILNAVETSLARERSMLNYLTGLLVLLGLIGTFIGLMEMVASVGKIIGGVANSDASSQEAIKGLMRDLERPLVGMATGFSASLFGLAGSLIVGLAARFYSDAAHAVKEEFEEWLAGIAQVERTMPDVDPTVSDTGVGVVANAIVHVFRSTQAAFDRSSDIIRAIADRQDRQTEALQRTIEQIETLTARQNMGIERLAAIDLIRNAVTDLRSDLADLARMQETRLSENASRLADLVETRSDALGEGLRDMLERQREIARATRSLEAQTATGFARIGQEMEAARKLQQEGFADLAVGQGHIETVIAENGRRIDADEIGRRIGDAVETRVSIGMNEIVRSLGTAFDRLGGGLDMIAATQDEVHKLLRTRYGADSELRALGQSLENGMAHGFAEVARAIDSVFAGYAELLRRERRRAEADMEAAFDLPPAGFDGPASGDRHAAPTPPEEDYDRLGERLRAKVAAKRS
jgi:hypothetical protein